MVPYPKSIAYNLETELSRGRSLLHCAGTKSKLVMQNGISLSYQLDQSFSVLRVVGWYSQTCLKQAVKGYSKISILRQVAA